MILFPSHMLSQAVQAVKLKAMSGSSHCETLMAVHVSIVITLSSWTHHVCEHCMCGCTTKYVTLNLPCMWRCMSHWTCPICDVVCHIEPVPYVMLYVTLNLSHMWRCMSHWTCPICDVVCHIEPVPYVMLYVTLNLSHMWCCMSHWTCPMCDVHHMNLSCIAVCDVVHHVEPVLYVMLYVITLNLSCMWCCTSRWTCPVCDVIRHHIEPVLYVMLYITLNLSYMWCCTSHLTYRYYMYCCTSHRHCNACGVLGRVEGQHQLAANQSLWPGHSPRLQTDVLWGRQGR